MQEQMYSQLTCVLKSLKCGLFSETFPNFPFSSLQDPPASWLASEHCPALSHVLSHWFLKGFPYLVGAETEA